MLFLLVISFLCFLSPASSDAQKVPVLTSPTSSVKVGQSFVVRVDNVPSYADVKWQWDPRLECDKRGITLLCKMDFLTGESSEVVISARIKSLKWSDMATIIIDQRGGRKIKPSGWSPDSQKMKDVKRMLDNLKTGTMTEADLIGFFKEMADKGLNVKEHLVAFKAEVVNSFGAGLVGNNFWEAEYGHIERELMFVRREGVNKAWEAAAIKYFQQHPDTPFIFKMDVGGWVKEGKEKMKFAGDIDFTIIMFDTEGSTSIRNLFESALKEMFGLDMLSIDALATAQRAATSAVYVGPYGADWAEIDAIQRGQISIIEYFGGRLQTRDATPVEKSLTFAILKNNVQKKLTGKDNLLELIKEKLEPKPTYDMEPGISLEFLRHIIEDGIHANLPIHEKIIKIAKYLNRSSIDHAKFLADVPGMTMSPKDQALVDGVKRIMDAKQGKGTPEQTLREIYKIAGEIMGPEWVNNPAEALQKMGNRALEIIKHNIAEGVKARLLMIGDKESQKKQEDADAERKRLLDDLATESEEFRKQGVEFPKEAHDTMIRLTEYFKKKLATLPAAEQKRLRELIERAIDNPNMAKIIIAMVQRRIQHYYKNPGEIIPAFNNFLDSLDNVTLEKMRATGVLELDIEGTEGEVTKYVLVSMPKIAEINKALNDSVLGKIGQNQAFQAFNLGMELESYYEAIANAENWTESFKNISVEIFRRRVPAGAAAEAFVQGNYLRTGIEVVYTIFPPIAIPEGLYGMASMGAEWSAGKFQQWNYDAVVDALFAGAKFEKPDKEWQISSITYKCPSGGDIGLHTREDILQLPQKCAGVYHVIIPQIKNHPVLMQLEEILEKKAVSSGKIGEFPYKYDTRGSKYGDEIYKLYRKKVDDVVLEYFKGVVEQLERAKKWASGSGYVDIIRIERELNCDKPLVTYTIGYLGGDAIRADAERFEKIVDNFNQIKKSSASIIQIKEKWKTDFPETEEKTDAGGEKEKKTTWVKELLPECSASSIEAKSKTGRDMLQAYQKGVQKAYTDVEKIVVVRDKVTDEILMPATQAGLCMAHYQERNRFIYKDCEESYRKALDELKKNASTLEVLDISGPETACVGKKVLLTASYDRKCDECVAVWESAEYRSEEFTGTGNDRASWIPKVEGKQTVRLKVRENRDSDKEIIKEKTVTVLGPDKCPKIKLSLRAQTTTIQENEKIDITVEPVGKLPEGIELTEYAWTENGRKQKVTGKTYAFTGTGKKGRKVPVSVRAKTNTGDYTDGFSIEITVSDTGKDELTVFLLPKELAVLGGEKPVTLTADVVRKTDSGRMKYQWTVKVNNETRSVNNENVQAISLDPKTFREGDIIDVSLLVLDIGNTYGTSTYGQILREGKGKKTLTVTPSGDLEITLSELPSEIEDNKDLNLCVTKPVPKPGEPVNRYTYEWQERRETSSDISGYWYTLAKGLNPCISKSAAAQSGKTIRLKVIVTDTFGRSAEREASPVTVVDAGTARQIAISVNPENANVTDDQLLSIVVSATPLPDSGRLKFNGVLQQKGVTSVTFPVSFKGDQNLVSIPFVVEDEKGRKAEKNAFVYVTRKEDKEKAEKEKAEKEKAEKDKAKKDMTEKEKAEKEKAEKNRSDKEKAEKEKAEKEKTGEQKPPDGGGADTEKLSFAGTAPDIWEGGNYENYRRRGFRMKRKKAASVRSYCSQVSQYPPYVVSNIWGEIDPSFAPRTEKEILSELNGQAETAKKWGKTAPIRPIAIGDFKGYFIDGPVEFNPGGWGDAGYRPDGVSVEGIGYLIKGEQRIELGYSVSGRGCWDNTDRAFLEAQAHAAQDEAKAILAGLQLVVNGSMAKTPYNGPKLDGSDMPKVTLSPPSLEKLKVGDTVNVQAMVENAKPEDSPFSYNWGGTFDGKPEDMKKKASVKIKPSKPGKYNLSVSVDGARFNLGSASLQYEVAEYKVKLERVPPENKPVPVGGNVKFKATVTVDGKETTGNLIFRWQPNTEVDFSNNEVTPDTTSPRNETVATFTKTGRPKIFVEILEPRGEKTSSTVAVSNQIEIEVIQPKLKLTANNKSPKVGDTVVLTVHEDPKMDDKTISFWWEYSGNAVNPGPVPNIANSRAYSFKPKDTNPVTVTVHAKAKDRGDDLGQEKIAITATSYTVTVSEPRYLGPKPRIWKCDTQLGGACPGLVEVGDTQFAVFRDIFMKATVTPSPDSPRYNWTVSPAGSCGFPGSGSEIRINCSSTGTYTVKVEVTNSDGAKLGEAAQAVTISISQEQIDGGKKAKDAPEKLQEAKKLAQQGKIDEAIKIAEEAAKIDPNAARPLLNELSATSKKAGWNSVYNRDFKDAVKRLDDAVRLNPADDDARHKLEQAKRFAGIWPQVEAKAREFESLIGEKKVFSAEKKMLEIQQLQHEMTGGMANPLSQKVTDEFHKAMQEYNQFSQESTRRHNEYFKSENWEAMLRNAQDMTKRELSPAGEKEAQSRMQFARQKLAEQQLKSTEKTLTSSSGQGASSQFYFVDLTPYGGKKRTPRKVKTIEVDDGSWIRLKATHEKMLTLDISLPAPVPANSIAIVSNLDNATYVKDDVTTTVLTVYTQSGNHTFEIKAGVHSSEWNRSETGGADHRFPKDTYIGDSRWMAVFQLPQGSTVTGMRFDHRDTDKKYYHSGAAPGFCLRGITLVRSGAGMSGVSQTSDQGVSAETTKGKVIFDNGNVGGVSNNPTGRTTFTINQPHVITLIQNYHWNNARGSTPGTISLGNQYGQTFGPWPAKGSPGSGGVPNAYWSVYPSITISGGTYTIIDSDPSTWAKNSGSQGSGFSRVEGYPVSGGPLLGDADFEKPTYKGYRLDICRAWTTDCGKGAADAFCRTKGFASAKSWEIDHDIGHISPTIVISGERICNQSFCDGFKFIKCAK